MNPKQRREPTTHFQLGNDVVDLTDSDNRRSWSRPRFVERVCQPGELCTVRASPDPMVAFWAIFAAKEAAFKTLVKSLGSFPLVYRQFCVSRDFRHVTTHGVRAHLWVEFEKEYVHAVVSVGQGKTHAWVRQSAFPGTQSEAARQLLAERAASLLRCERAALRIERTPRPGSWDGYAPPVLVRAGRVQTLDVSLSHDGKFVACALG